MYNEQLTQALAVVGVKHAAILNGATDILITDVDISKFKRLMFILDIGLNATSVDAKLRESKTSGGTYQDVTGGAITQITAASKTATIEIRADQLSAGYQFVQLSITTVGSATLSAVCLGGEANAKPGGTSVGGNDVASVTQRLVV